MDDQKNALWPHSKTAAVVVTPLALILFFIIFALIERYAGWPHEESRNLVLAVAFLVAFVPLLLVLLDFIRINRGIVDIAGKLRIDFSQVDLNRPDVTRESFGLPDNIGERGTPIGDSGGMEIMSALHQATKSEIALLDIKDGNAWWLTRLFALSAGASRAGSPKAFVFIGVKGNQPGAFLGWADPSEIVRAILDSNEQYRTRYQRSQRIANQIGAFGASELLPTSPVGISLHDDVNRYAHFEELAALGDAAFEQILMDQLRMPLDSGPGTRPRSLEDPPDRLTLGRLSELFEHCLYRDAIDLFWPNEQQIAELLESRTPYVALTKDDRYQSMLKRDEGERLIIRELFAQMQSAQA